MRSNHRTPCDKRVQDEKKMVFNAAESVLAAIKCSIFFLLLRTFAEKNRHIGILDE